LINVLYMTSSKPRQRYMATNLLGDREDFNVIPATTWAEFVFKLKNMQVDIIVSGIMFSDIEQSFGLFFDHWQKNYSAIPFIAHSIFAKDAPKALLSTRNFFAHCNDSDKVDYKSLPNLISDIVHLNRTLQKMPIYSNPYIVNKDEQKFYESYFKERVRETERMQMEEKRKIEMMENERRLAARKQLPLYHKVLNFLLG